MIKWNRYSYLEIKNKWKKFHSIRNKSEHNFSMNNKSFITCLDRESLIDNLMSRLEDEMTKNFKESIGK